VDQAAAVEIDEVTGLHTTAGRIFDQYQLLV